MTIPAVRIFLPMILLIGQAQAAGFSARITLPDGATRISRVEGVGCSAAICSRVAIKGTTEAGSLLEKRFASIAAIKETSLENALFVLRDGTATRLSLTKDFRVLYLMSPSDRAEKLDLSRIKSVEFLPSSK